MGYFEAAKAALIAGKWIVLAVAIAALFAYVYWLGYSSADDQCKLREQAIQIETNRILREETNKTMQETAKSSAYASFIEREYNAKVDEIHNTHDQLNFNSVRERTACKGRSSAVPTNNPTVVHDEPADYHDAGFSTEFKQFLESQARRDKLNTAWIEAAVKEAKNLCQQPNVTCTGLLK